MSPIGQKRTFQLTVGQRTMQHRILLRLIAIAVSASALMAQSQNRDEWFNIVGDQFDPTQDVVQLNIGNVKPRGKIKLMDLRVNLAKQRTMASGEKYTSYTSVIAVECDTSSVFHIEQTRYVEPRWAGTGTRQVFPEDRPMAFGGLSPAPKPVVLRAACAKSTSGAQR
ncbi:MAG: hypothetical protein EOP84_36585 [Verrucomicrobiaceae bacterium]|nr:MAG: hypothetical protein EOP84_36585 [Verrucomicrobiaceae bacterium]